MCGVDSVQRGSPSLSETREGFGVCGVEGGGRSVPPWCLTGEKEGEGEEVERDAVLGITSQGGLELLKTREWYFLLFQ